MKKFDVITIGGAVKDITFYTDKGRFFPTPENLTAQKMLAFEYGAKINVKELYLSLGGGAANTAVSFSLLGLKVASIFKVGADHLGQEIIANLKKEKIATEFIQIDKKQPTGLSVIIAVTKGEREHIVFTNRGANNSLLITSSQLAKLKADWFYISSLSGGNWLKNLKLIFQSAKQNNIKLAWNPGSLQLQAGKRILAAFLQQTDILILNKDEAIELVLSGIKLGRKDPRFLNKPVYLLNILKEWGPKMIVITNGKQGAWAYDGKKIHSQKICKAKVVNTTGVGDAFGSSFLAGVINSGNLTKALKWGMVNTSSVVTKVGAQSGLLTIKELKNKL